ncbi:hypothetical protein BZG36_04719 [Bifiguratus adelaidae]|uniref:Peptidase S8/S53 domain-containing protein n=1 Tax=Bifiguratus adelaidae TaxID=1938954 RepID=A0A261XV50_9FUNG|nr:hypothetical protein BZG36_04719 [Bifiguratus adelaidae]
MKRLSVCCALLLALTWHQTNAIDVSQATIDKYTKQSSSFIVEFNTPDISQYSALTFAKAAAQTHQDYIAKLQTQGYIVQTRQNYTSTVFNGISLSVQKASMKTHGSSGIQPITFASKVSSSRSDLMDALSDPTVKAVYPVKVYQRPKIWKSDSMLPNILDAKDMTGAALVHGQLGITGKGVKVGIIDSGMDYTHPALGGCFGPGCKVAYEYDLVGDLYDGTNRPMPDGDPLDHCGIAYPSTGEGHGTHVSGIVAANDRNYNFTGVSPGVELGMWRVFGCTGGSPNDVLIQAMLMAQDAGMDIISMSLGAMSGWQEDPLAAVADRIAQKGTYVVVANGNDGSMGALLASSPGTGAHVPTPRLGPLSLADVPLVPTSANITLTNDACTGTLISSAVRGKAALIQRGGCSFADKALNAQNAGAIAAFIWNRGEDGAIAPSVDRSNVTIPVAGIDNASGLLAFQNTKMNGSTLDYVNITTSSGYIGVPIPTAGTISDFSSRGPLFELQMKPDIGGIGGSVFSTLPSYLHFYGTYSGTSMATPYITGSIALYLEATRNKTFNGTTPNASRQLYNYAIPAVRNNSVPGVLDNPTSQGAGLVHIYNAIVGQASIEPTRLSFNDSAHFIPVQNLTLTHFGAKAATYTFLHQPSMATYAYQADDVAMAEPDLEGPEQAAVNFSMKQITLLSGESANFSVTLTPPATNKTRIVYGG